MANATAVVGSPRITGEDTVARLKAIAMGGRRPPKVTLKMKLVAVVAASRDTVALVKPAFTSAVCIAAVVLTGFVLSKRNGAVTTAPTDSAVNWVMGRTEAVNVSCWLMDAVAAELENVTEVGKAPTYAMGGRPLFAVAPLSEMLKPKAVEVLSPTTVTRVPA